MVIFFKLRSLQTAFTTSTFFFTLSTKLKLHSGKNIDNGTPGKPPPVPKSRMLVPALKSTNFAMDKE